MNVYTHAEPNLAHIKKMESIFASRQNEMYLNCIVHERKTLQKKKMFFSLLMLNTKEFSQHPKI